MTGAARLSSHFMSALAEVESRFPVLEWRVEDTPIWPLLRVRWMFAEWGAMRIGTDVRQSASRSGNLRHLRTMVLGTFGSLTDSLVDARGRDRRPARRDLVFLSDGLSFARVGVQWVERFCDPLIDQARTCGWSSALWIPGYFYRRPRRTPASFVQAGIDRANLCAALRNATAQVSVPMHGEVVATLSRHGFGTDSIRVDRIVSDGRRLRAIADFFAAKLRRTQPKLALVVSFYNLEGFAFVLACREAGVPVVDLQHGVQGSMHPAYAAWPRPPGGVHALLPDRFWVWSRWEQEVISQWAAGTAHRALVGGNPWMDAWQRDDSDWPAQSEVLAAGRALKMRSGGRPVILVTLQFGLASSEQIDPLARLIEHAAHRFAFWVRLHPIMLKDREEVRDRLGDVQHFFLDEPTDLPLQALLPCVDLHLTHSSSTVIEAAQFGVRSVLTTEWGAELFEPLAREGWTRVEKGGAEQLAATFDRILASEHATCGLEAHQGAALEELMGEAADPLREARP